MKIISVQTMRDLDRATIDGGTPGEVLMERAGRGAYIELLTFADTIPEKHVQRVAIIAGKGNNGGDGYVIARLLDQEAGIPACVYSVCPTDELQGDAKLNADRLPESVPVVHCPDSLPNDALLPGTIVVDALLGTGISGPLRPPYPTLIKQINESGLPVVAIDIPSGLDGDTGAIATDAVVADSTVTMALPKTGLFNPNGRKVCGKIRCIDIGIPSNLVDQAPSTGNAIFANDIRPFLQRRPRDSHKYTFGHTVVFGGSNHYTGAPLLAASAALRTGAGLTTVAAPESVLSRMTPTFDALINVPVPEIPDAGPTLTREGILQIPELGERATALVLGPGVGRSEHIAELTEEVLTWNLPTVIDADALICLAKTSDRFPTLDTAILTPHPGEMKKLMNGYGLDSQLVETDRTAAATELARKTGAVVVLKGMTTVIATPDGQTWLNSSGTAALATAGTGDVLAGMIGAFLAQGLDRADAAKTAVFLHGYAAEIATLPERGLVADDLINLIPTAMQQVSPLA